MKDNETRQKFVEMRGKGMSFRKISKELNIAKSTLMAWSKEHLTEIENLKAIELESLQEQFYMTKKARIELLGGQLERIKLELEQRDYSDIPTDKLFEVFNKILNQLKQEELEVIFKGKADVIEDIISSNLVSWKP